MTHPINDVRRIAKIVTALIPALYPVSVQKMSVSSKDEYGDCSIGNIRGKKKIVIRIADFSTWDREMLENALTKQIAVHELAHALQYRPEHQENAREDDHDEEFGHYYAKIWRLAHARLDD